MAGRHSRDWTKRTYTVSPEVAEAVGVRAAHLGIDPGTVIDDIVWKALLKPNDDLLRAGGLSNEMLERHFAEEVLDHIDSPSKVRWLSTRLQFQEEKGTDLDQTSRMVKRWRTTRRIEKERQEEVLAILGEEGWVPRILLMGAVEPEWFVMD